MHLRLADQALSHPLQAAMPSVLLHHTIYPAATLSIWQARFDLLLVQVQYCTKQYGCECTPVGSSLL